MVPFSALLGPSQFCIAPLILHELHLLFSMALNHTYFSTNSHVIFPLVVFDVKTDECHVIISDEFVVGEGMIFVGIVPPDGGRTQEGIDNANFFSPKGYSTIMVEP